MAWVAGVDPHLVGGVHVSCTSQESATNDQKFSSCWETGIKTLFMTRLVLIIMNIYSLFKFKGALTTGDEVC